MRFIALGGLVRSAIREYSRKTDLLQTGYSSKGSLAGYREEAGHLCLNGRKQKPSDRWRVEDSVYPFVLQM